MPMIFEPWTPEDGQRVRVRLSPECQGANGGVGAGVSHTPEINGRVGRVDTLLSRLYQNVGLHIGLVFDPKHPWVVVLDRRPEDPWVIGVSYSAWELEPIHD